MFTLFHSGAKYMTNTHIHMHILHTRNKHKHSNEIKAHIDFNLCNQIKKNNYIFLNGSSRS